MVGNCNFSIVEIIVVGPSFFPDPLATLEVECDVDAICFVFEGDSQ